MMMKKLSHPAAAITTCCMPLFYALIWLVSINAISSESFSSSLRGRVLAGNGQIGQIELSAIHQILLEKCKRSDTDSNAINRRCKVIDLPLSHWSFAGLLDTLESKQFDDTFHQPLLHKKSENGGNGPYYRYFVVLSISPSAVTPSTTTPTTTIPWEPDMNLLQQYRDLDRFIEEHPWWIVKQYPRRLSVSTDSSFTHSYQPLILERVPIEVELASRDIVQRDFPPTQAECNKRPLIVKTGVGSWGNDEAVNQRIFFRHFPSCTHMLYITPSGKFNEPMDYISTVDCPNDEVDKHQCVFMKITNCTIPKQLRNCHGTESTNCIREGLYIPDPSKQSTDVDELGSIPRIYYEPGSNDARPLRDESAHFWNHFTKILSDQGIPHSPQYTIDRVDDIIPYVNYFHHTAAIAEGLTIKNSHYSHSSGHSTGSSKTSPIVPFSLQNNTKHDDKIEQIGNDYHLITWMFNVLYKYNHRLHLQIYDFLNDFYQHSHGHTNNGQLVAHGHENAIGQQTEGEQQHRLYDHHIDPNTRCIALHLRMGDRHLNDSTIDMNVWCKEHTNEKETDWEKRVKGKWIDGSPLTIGQWFDMGCSSRVPFGTLTMHHVIAAAQVINEDIKDILILTDDHHWMHKMMKDYHGSNAFRSDIKFHVVPTKTKYVHDARFSFKATAEWWAGIEAARQCEGLVGHVVSAATSAIYHSMCFQHAGNYWKCPPYYYFS